MTWLEFWVFICSLFFLQRSVHHPWSSHFGPPPSLWRFCQNHCFGTHNCLCSLVNQPLLLFVAVVVIFLVTWSARSSGISATSNHSGISATSNHYLYLILYNLSFSFVTLFSSVCINAIYEYLLIFIPAKFLNEWVVTTNTVTLSGMGCS